MKTILFRRVSKIRPNHFETSEMSRSNTVDKIVLGALLCVVTLTAIGYRRLYLRAYEKFGFGRGDEYSAGVGGNEVLRKRSIDTVTVDVYYESLCSDSRSFIVEQLAPTVHLLGDRISLRMIPYGKSQMVSEGRKTEFNCQHGHRECLGNKYHACIVDRTRNNASLQVGVVSCVIDSIFSPVGSSAMKCCRRYGLNFYDIKVCATGQEGTDLLKCHGQSTKPLGISFVPTIVMNRVYGGENYQSKILKDLKGEVCEIMKYNNTSDREINEACDKN